MPDSRALAAAAEAADATEPPTDVAQPAADGAEPAADDEATVADETGSAAQPRPPMVQFSRGPMYGSPGVDSYSLRLITHRKLYDLGVLVQHSPSIAALAPGSTLLVHPYDLDRLGVADGGRVKISSPRNSLTVEAHASTAIPKGSAALAVNQPGPNPADLIDATLDVTDLRVDTL
jgi:anaerobic selenocysteine-containing dehydrogenase